MNTRKIILMLATVFVAVMPSQAQDNSSSVHYLHNDSYEDMEAQSAKVRNAVVYVNDVITTHIIMPEVVKVVDLSSDKIVGNQFSENIVRLKPAKHMMDHELLGTVTIVGERNIAQLDVVYTKGPAKANSVYKVGLNSLMPYENPDISMPLSEMSKYAWAIYSQPQHFHNIHTKKYGIRAVVNNIYSIGDYFFIDYSLYNRTNIKYDIDEVRVRLSDKKETKATNSQTIELTPVYSLNKAHSFRKGYRNVLVLNRLTFPDEKVLTIEVSESQISGRVISIPIEYTDILSADGFSEDLMRELESGTSYTYATDVPLKYVKPQDTKERDSYRSELEQLKSNVESKRNDLQQLDGQIAESKKTYQKLSGKIESMRNALSSIGDLNE